MWMVLMPMLNMMRGEHIANGNEKEWMSLKTWLQSGGCIVYCFQYMDSKYLYIQRHV